jgi:hypothetical protein
MNQMTDKEKFQAAMEILHGILDGMVYASDLVRITGLSEDTCAHFLNTYWTLRSEK